MGKRLGFAGDAFVTVLAALFIVVVFGAAMFWIIHSLDEQEAACTHAGGQWTRHYRSYECVHPNPPGSK